MLKKTHRLRLLLLAAMSLGAFGVIIWRLYVVQIEMHQQFRIRADHQQNKKIHLIPRRGDILDRNGLKLATSYVSNTIYIDTRAFERAERKFSPELADMEQAVEISAENTGTTDSTLALAIKTRFSRQKVEEDAKDRARARQLWEKRNRDKLKAWDELGVADRLVEELAEALATAGDSLDVDIETSSGLEVGPRRMSHARAREIVEGMFVKPKRHLFYRKAPEELTRKMLAIEARYALPDGFVVYEKHSKRFYPNGSLASHLIGFTSIDPSGDNVGIAGVEQQYDERLKGNYATQKIQINSGQRGLAPLDESVIASTYGDNVVLTIDSQLQMHAEQALRTQVGRYQAKGGVALVMDVRTGGILAMTSCPDFDVNHFKTADQTLQLKNRILTDPIEIGSVMKIITATLLIDKGLLKPDEIIDCSSPKVFGTRVVRDVHSMGSVPFRAAFAESSNVGLVSVGLRLEPHTYYDGLVRFGLGQPTQIDLPGEGNGVLRPVDQWSALSRSSLPMGYETSMTPLQVVSALSAIANDGVRLRPHLIKEIRSPQGDVLETYNSRTADRVASPETCATIRELMEAVVIEGTGKAALIPGYRVGGKTGTTVKYNIRSEDAKRKYYSSFAGLFPIDNPRVAIYTYIDEPQGAKYGGTVAAPIFREIAMAAAQAMAIPPNDPVLFAQAKAKEMGLLGFDSSSSNTLIVTSETMQRRLLAEADEMELHPAAEGSIDSESTYSLGAGLADGNGSTATWATVLATDPDAKPTPDLRGLTMAAAYARLAEMGIEAELDGAGVAVSQDPLPGAPLRVGEKLKLKFMLASERSRTNPDRLQAALPASDSPAQRFKNTATGTDRSKPERVRLTPMVPGSRQLRIESDQAKGQDESQTSDESAGSGTAAASE